MVFGGIRRCIMEDSDVAGKVDSTEQDVVYRLRMIVHPEYRILMDSKKMNLHEHANVKQLTVRKRKYATWVQSILKPTHIPMQLTCLGTLMDIENVLQAILNQTNTIDRMSGCHINSKTSQQKKSVNKPTN